jgi:hypothetical protein
MCSFRKDLMKDRTGDERIININPETLKSGTSKKNRVCVSAAPIERAGEYTPLRDALPASVTFVQEE